MKPHNRSVRKGKALLGVMVDPRLREQTHLAVRRLAQYGNLTEFIVAKAREVIEEAGLSLDDVCILDSHRVLVGDVEVNVRAGDYGVCHSRAHYGSNDCWHVHKACAAWAADPAASAKVAGHSDGVSR